MNEVYHKQMGSQCSNLIPGRSYSGNDREFRTGGNWVRSMITSMIGLLLVATIITNNQAFADSSLPGMAAQASEYFFTGKPFDSDLGDFIFKYRSYNSESGRWRSADPSGFPDGLNNRVYAPCPTFGFDPFGLDTVTVTGIPNSGTTGSTMSIEVLRNGAQPLSTNNQGTFEVQWHVHTTNAGWVIQHVKANYDNVYNDSDNSQYTNVSSIEYWEAWEWDGSSFVDFTGEDLFVTAYFPDSTHGEVSITGNVTFYRKTALENYSGNNNPANWLPGDNGGAIEANQLLSTYNEPTAWWTDSNTYIHKLTVSWE